MFYFFLQNQFLSYGLPGHSPVFYIENKIYNRNLYGVDGLI